MKTIITRIKNLFHWRTLINFESYVYVLVRNDLTPAQKAVQGTHAAIELAQKYIFKIHPSVIYIVVKNESKLKSIMRDLDKTNTQYISFQEPDIGNEYTAITSKPLTGIDRKYFQKFQLLK